MSIFALLLYGPEMSEPFFDCIHCWHILSCIEVGYIDTKLFCIALIVFATKFMTSPTL